MHEEPAAAALCPVPRPDSHDGLAKVIAEDGSPWCVLRDGEDWLATPALCPHRGRDLSACGVVEDGVLTCLGHLWQWNLRDGGSPLGAAERPLQIVRLVRRGDALYLPA